MNVKLLPVLALPLLAHLLMSPPVHADWLDQMDRAFEETFQKTDKAFDKAMREGAKEIDQELAKIWTDGQRLPEPKVWVGYSEDKKSRITVDYETGSVSLESFDKSQDDLFREFQDVLGADQDQLDERDRLKQKLIEKTRPFLKREDDFEENQPRKTKRKTWRRSPELARLIKARTRPTFKKRIIENKDKNPRTYVRLSIPLRKDRDTLSAQSLIGPVHDMAQKYNLSASLIFSMIKNESAFNPRARSHANALGLMQLVPTSGGKEAYSYIKGRELTPGPDVLYDPEQNIELGTTYLHLLNSRYFGKVRNHQTRQYLIIAAYNTGAGNVAKAFTGKMKLRPAIQKINSMTPDQVYAHLIKHLPYEETRTYLSRIQRDLVQFEQFEIT
jgi:membrane-bound lytic murein transglycosylase C